MGYPNYMDPIEKKYYFFSEQKNVKNFYNKKIINRKIIVFEFDDNEIIKSALEFNLNDQNNIEYIDEKTSLELIKRGLIEKIFGGVGTAPSTTNY